VQAADIGEQPVWSRQHVGGGSWRGRRLAGTESSQRGHDDDGHDPRPAEHGLQCTASAPEASYFFTGFFAVVGVLPLVKGHPPRPWALAVAAAFLVAALAVPRVLRPLNRAWFLGGELLHRVVSPVATGIVFFLVLTPVALVTRVFKKDLLHLRFDPAADSYWIVREQGEAHDGSMSNQF